MDRIIKMLVLVLVQVAAVAVVVASSIAKPGCQDECGGVKIPYPFGIGDGCFYTRPDLQSYFYSITCDETTNPHTPIYNTTIPIINTPFNSPILNINLDDHSFRLNTLVAYDCFPNNNQSSMHFRSVVGVMGFTVNTTRNKFVAIGCDTIATFQGYRFSKDVYYYSTGCITYCTSMDFIQNGTCTGFGCCETSVPYGANYVSSDLGSYYSHSKSSFNPCSTAFVVEDGAFNFSTLNLTYKADYYTEGHIRVPVVVDWSIINATCNQTTGQDKVICGSNTQCIDGVYATLTNSYRCQCSSGYSGNPYLPQGCQDIDECSDPTFNDCQKREYCVNTEGGYHCKCPSGYHGSATNTDKCILSVKVLVSIGLGVGLGSIISFIILTGLYKVFIRRKQIRERTQNFKKNGGLLLQQDMSSNEGAIDRTKIFSQRELEKATDNFNDNRVLGRGGQGTVYKGMLIDGTIVAVKKSVKIDETQLAQFINEVVILSQINHRNIVKLFGCCLETEVPMLIYEFVPYGTLYQHIHHPNEDFPFTWRARLQIAVECAGAIAYLHSSCSFPIYHRDIKSSNILLDEKYRAKISDFGTSKTISIDKTHVTTCVQGTFGYLDPEFFQSSQFTDKSDVYSFGVVLLELLTSKRPIFTTTSGETKGLATEFVQLVETNAKELDNILDPQVLQRCSEEEIEALTKLIKRCLSLNGKQRPTMKEVAMTLEMIKSHQGGEEGNSTTEYGINKQDGVMWTEMGMMYEGPCSTSTTSAFADSSYFMDVHPLLFDTNS